MKRHRLTYWIHKQDPTLYCNQETHLRHKDRHYLNLQCWKTIFKENASKNEADVFILISNKIDFQTKVITKDNEGHFIILKEKIYQDELRTYILQIQGHTRAPAFMKETSLKLKAHIKHHTIIVGEFKTILSSMNK